MYTSKLSHSMTSLGHPDLSRDFRRESSSPARVWGKTTVFLLRFWLVSHKRVTAQFLVDHVIWQGKNHLAAILEESSIFNFLGVIFSVITLIQTLISTSTVRFY